MKSEKAKHQKRRNCSQLDEGVAALADARTCVQLTPSWPKGRFREGCCLRQLGLLEDAQRAFAAGQKLEPDNKEWCKELEKTEKLLLAQPAYQVPLGAALVRMMAHSS